MDTLTDHNKDQKPIVQGESSKNVTQQPPLAAVFGALPFDQYIQFQTSQAHNFNENSWDPRGT
jgi:hypothetical protein